eukprot:comp19201_c0_seq1/m.21928 comp19201_c0_seq1/g.21928  ORF comp19201_c0_seq1/g.21928 comp19201_c0_seq1/m.21928 type:complete len:681 (-) comp19201_c0_seq1:640-2682(-)
MLRTAAQSLASPVVQAAARAVPMLSVGCLRALQPRRTKATMVPNANVKVNKNTPLYVLPQTAEDVLSVTVNGKQVNLKKDCVRPNGDKGAPTVLEACKAAGVSVPTLCYHPSIKKNAHSATCRLCMVSVQENGWNAAMKPACNTPIADGMTISTNTPEIEKNVHSNLTLLKARHPNECMTCDVNGRCEFQNLLYKYKVEDTLEKEPRSESGIDSSSPSLNRDMSKCVLCQRCVNVCEVSQNMNILGFVGRGSHTEIMTFDGTPLEATECINCGQCSVVCPVGAISETDHLHPVMTALKERKKIVVAQTAPAVRVTLAEDFDMEPGWIKPGQMVSAMKHLGFDYVFDTNYSADLTTMEEAYELIRRVQKGGPFPMFTSCCPAWVNLCEKQYPQFTKNLSSCRSPQGMLGSVIRNHFAKNIGVKPDDICVVSVMPCTAKKDEASRKQLTYKVGDELKPDVDYVLTTRELAHLMRAEQVPVYALAEAGFDNPLGLSTGAGEIFGVTGGVMESALRTAYEALTGKKLEKVEFDMVRGLQGVKEATIPLELKDGSTLEIKIAIVHGTASMKQLLDSIVKGEKFFHFVEMMSCTGGCIGGGGNPKSQLPDMLKRRINAVYDLDRAAPLRKAQENPDIAKLYKETLGEPGSHIAEEWLHTHYHDRSAKARAAGTDKCHGPEDGGHHH